jgi:hypothetical protein
MSILPRLLRIESIEELLELANTCCNTNKSRYMYLALSILLQKGYFNKPNSYSTTNKITKEELENVMFTTILCCNEDKKNWKEINAEFKTDKNGKANATYNIRAYNGTNKRCSFLKKAIEIYNSL